jgi:hypothetical protein
MRRVVQSAPLQRAKITRYHNSQLTHIGDPGPGSDVRLRSRFTGKIAGDKKVV